MTGIASLSSVPAEGSLDVYLQDQTTRSVDFALLRSIGGPYTLANPTVVGSYDIELTAGHPFVGGEMIFLASAEQRLTALVMSVLVNVITLNIPVPVVFPVATTYVGNVSANMNVNGSVTPVAFYVLLGAIATVSIDITRVHIWIVDDAAMDDTKFAGIAALTRGCLPRIIRADGSIEYSGNTFRTNGELGLSASEKTYEDKSGGGLYGLTVRYILGGQSGRGVVIRLDPGDRFEILVQDDLTAVSSIYTTAQGHYVSPLV